MTPSPRPLTALPASALAGTVRVPGDKSISHRAVLLSGLAHGRSRIDGLLEADDVFASAAAMRAMGAELSRQTDGQWLVHGTGNGALLDPATELDLGNSGTGVRLLMGLCAGQGVTAAFTGDASLRKRPMGRVIEPLCRMGADISASEGGRLPLRLRGSAPAIPITYELPVASAQVKSAVLLAGLNSLGATSVVERVPTRDHTERMLRHFGADILVETDGESRKVAVRGGAELAGKNVVVPGDPSSAAFAIVAGLLVPGSAVTVNNVMTNPTRSGLWQTLQEMGAELVFENARDEGGEPVADMRVSAGPLKAVEVPARRAASMIDEYPILSVAAAAAKGRTVMRGLGELRVKESDRLAAIAAGLAQNGVSTEISGDDLIVEGCAGAIPGGGLVNTHMDHRIAMAFLVLGLAAREPCSVDDTAMIATSFPGFVDTMRALGAAFQASQAPAA